MFKYEFKMKKIVAKNQNKKNESFVKIFENRKIAIATMHKKEAVIAPIIKKELGVKVIVPKDFDTDRFGTFTRDIKRKGSQLEVARKKAEAAMSITGLDLAIASEGTFGAHPSVPFLQSNLELILLIDKKNNLEIRGHYRSATNMNATWISTLDEAMLFAENCGFPENGLILRRTQDGNRFIYKNIRSIEDFSNRVNKMLSWPFTKKIFIETDMRAHRNPMRMRVIEQATKDLVKNISSTCPKCQAPGFIVYDFEKGLPCSFCKIPTDLPLNDIYKCLKCGFSKKKLVTKYGKSADPRYCSYCNP